MARTEVLSINGEDLYPITKSEAVYHGDDKLSDVIGNTDISAIGDGTITGAVSNINDRIDTMKTNFQAGCDKIASAITAKGGTVASNDIDGLISAVNGMSSIGGEGKRYSGNLKIDGTTVADDISLKTVHMPIGKNVEESTTKCNVLFGKYGSIANRLECNVVVYHGELYSVIRALLVKFNTESKMWEYVVPYRLDIDCPNSVDVSRITSFITVIDDIIYVVLYGQYYFTVVSINETGIINKTSFSISSNEYYLGSTINFIVDTANKYVYPTSYNQPSSSFNKNYLASYIRIKLDAEPTIDTCQLDTSAILSTETVYLLSYFIYQGCLHILTRIQDSSTSDYSYKVFKVEGSDLVKVYEISTTGISGSFVKILDIDNIIFADLVSRTEIDFYIYKWDGTSLIQKSESVFDDIGDTYNMSYTPFLYNGVFHIFGVTPWWKYVSDTTDLTYTERTTVYIERDYDRGALRYFSHYADNGGTMEFVDNILITFPKYFYTYENTIYIVSSYGEIQTYSIDSSGSAIQSKLTLEYPYTYYMEMSYGNTSMTYNSDIYIFGGVCDPFGMYKYSKTNNTWERIGNLPYPILDSSSTYDCGNNGNIVEYNGYLYMFPALEPHDSYSDYCIHVYKWDGTNWTCEGIYTNCSSIKSSIRCVHNNKFYFLGTSRLYTFEPSVGITQVTSSVSLPSAGYNAALISFNNNLYLYNYENVKVSSEKYTRCKLYKLNDTCTSYTEAVSIDIPNSAYHVTMTYSIISNKLHLYIAHSQLYTDASTGKRAEPLVLDEYIFTGSSISKNDTYIIHDNVNSGGTIFNANKYQCIPSKSFQGIGVNALISDGIYIIITGDPTFSTSTGYFSSFGSMFKIESNNDSDVILNKLSQLVGKTITSSNIIYIKE